jgi:CotH kinase protein
VIAEGRQTRRVVLWLLPVAMIGVGLLIEARESFPLLRFGITRAPELAPSTVSLPADEMARGVSTVSLYVRPDDLHDPKTGILANRRKHGSDWERPGWVSFFENGRVVHSAGVGVRIHGGSSRELKRPQGFRLYFRRKFGSTALPGEVAFGPSHEHPLRRLVLHNDLRIARDGVRWHMVNPLAYDIAAAVGAITSATRPVRFVLNGVFQDVYVLTEHFHARDYFEAHRGHRVSMDADEFERVWRQVRAIRPLRMAPVGQLVDLDNLTRWFIASVFCATKDAYQGPGQYRDPMRPSAQWFWVNWDMDASFREPEQDSFSTLLSRTGRRRARRPNDPRPLIITTLLDEDAEYRAYFQRVWTDVMNHVLTPAFLDQRYEHYRAEASRLGLQDRGYLVPLRQFLDRRPTVAWQIAERWLGTGASVRCRIGGTRGAVVINGREVPTGWQGSYFPGTRITLAVPPELAFAFSHWAVNGTDITGATLTLETTSPLDIEPIWARGATLPQAP